MPDETEKLEPLDALKSSTDQKPLTVDERIQNCELVIAHTVQKVEEVLKVYAEEIQKTQRAVINIMKKGTKNQKKLLTPAEYRKPYGVVS